MTKVGFYAVLRIWTLFFPPGSSDTFLFGADALIWIGLATLAFGTIGVWGAQRLDRLVAFSLIVSSGTLLAAAGFAVPALTGGALYYLLGSTLAASAFFLLIELLERSRLLGDDPALCGRFRAEGAPFMEPTRPGVAAWTPISTTTEQALIGRAVPAGARLPQPVLRRLCAGDGRAAALLGISGEGRHAHRAPTSGRPRSESVASGDRRLEPPGPADRFGIGLDDRAGAPRHSLLWAPQGRPAPRLRMIECLPVGMLLTLCVGLSSALARPFGSRSSAAETLLRAASATSRP